MVYVVMFHHFHDDDAHPAGQGSIDANGFEEVIDYLDQNHELIDAQTFATRVREGRLTGRESCLSFDDGLKCQYDIARPALEARNLGAFFFVYTNVFTQAPTFLEFYRDFRMNSFEDVEAFYAAFFNHLEQEKPEQFERCQEQYPDDYLKDYPFYTLNDRRFRFCRDQILGLHKYDALMQDMMASHGYDHTDRASQLFMKPDDVKVLHEKGHVVGLHSHTHPTMMDTLDRAGQYDEYKTNQYALNTMTGGQATTMSHPCGRYNADTKEVLKDLGVDIGFLSYNKAGPIASTLEIPRDDHMNIYNKIHKH